MYDFRTVYFWAYFAISIGSAAMTLSYLNQNYPNLYSVGIVAGEGFPLLIFGNLIIALALGIGKLALTLSFGELRLIEVEHIHERAWPTLMGLGLSAAIYSRHENTLHLLILILGLLVFKVFTWITMDRLEMLIQRYQMNPNSSIRKTILSSPVLIALLLLRIYYAIISVLIDEAITEKHELLLVMAFEYFLVSLGLTKSGLKFFINVRELVYVKNHPDEEIWEFKSTLLAIVDLILSLINAILTPTVFILFISMGVIPTNLTGEIFHAFLDLTKSITTILKMNQTRKQLMNSVFDPSELDIEKDDLCIICRDELIIGGIKNNRRSIPKKISCGHVLHIGCLKSWLERSNGCPVCRKPVIITNIKNQNTVNDGSDANVNNNDNNNEVNAPNLIPLPGQHIVETPVQTQGILPASRQHPPLPPIVSNKTPMHSRLDEIISQFDDIDIPGNLRNRIQRARTTTRRQIPHSLQYNDHSVPIDWTLIKKTREGMEEEEDINEYLDFNKNNRLLMKRIVR